MKIFNILVTFGSFTGIETDNSITVIGIVRGKFTHLVVGPLRFTKIPEEL